MKKILLATSILAATTGFAAAEITLSGDARMGVVDYGNDPEFSARARVRFTMAGETDGGLAFGATFRADQASGAQSGNEDMSAGTVFVSGGFGKFEMGDVLSAAEAAFGDLDGVGYTGLNDYSDITYINGDGGDADSRGSISLNPVNQGTGSLFSYSNAGFGFYVGLFDGVAKVEKEHEARYRKLLANVEGGLVFSRDQDMIWQCSNCGHIVIGKSAPAICPVCSHPQAYFQIKPENY